MDWFTYSQIIVEKCKKQEIPFHVGIELTPYCNFNCNMCYVHLNPSEAKSQGNLLTKDQWFYIIDEAKKAGAVSMEITGGEAVTREDFPMIYQHAIEKGFLIVLRSNGYLLKDDILTLLCKYKPRVVMVTLYGASDETYKKVCGVDDGFTVVTSNLRVLKENGISIRLSSTITNDNVVDVPLMKAWAQQNGFHLSLGGHLFTPLRGSQKPVDHLQVRYPEENYKIPEMMIPSHRKIENKAKFMNPFWMCRNFGVKFSITWDGKMVLCYSNPSIWEDPFNKSLSDAFHQLNQKLREIHRPEKCKSCQYIDMCSVCPSMLLSATGSMEQTNDDMCKFAHRNYKNRLLHESERRVSLIGIPFDKCEEGE